MLPSRDHHPWQAGMSRRRDYGPIQLATFLGLEPWQLTRARQNGLIPGPDRPVAAGHSRWPRTREPVPGRSCWRSA